MQRNLSVIGVTLGLLACVAQAQPSNDRFANRSVVSGAGFTVMGSTIGATKENGEPYHAGDYGGASVWWSWTAPAAGFVSITTAGSSFDTLLGIYTGTSLWSLTLVGSNDDTAQGVVTSTVSFDVVAGQTYAIAVDGYWGDTGTVVLRLTYATDTRPANDLFANRIVISGTNTVVTGSNVGATRETGEPYHAGSAGGRSVWWSWTAPSTGTAKISTAGSTFDTVLGVYTGSSVSTLTEIASNDDDTTGYFTSEAVLDVAANQTYAIAVDGYDGDSGSVRLQVQLGPLVPPPPAPAWNLPDPYGQMLHSTDFAGKVIILNFWATWCGPCKAELPDLITLQERFRNDGLVVIGADVPWDGDNAQVVRSFLATFTPTINYPVIMANSAMMSAYGGISAVPTTFIIDRQNLIRKRIVGSQTEATFQRLIVPHLYGNMALTLQSEGDYETLRWPVTGLAFTLESTTTLANPAWTPWPVAPVIVGGMNTVSVPRTDQARFFRLRLPY